MSGFRDICRLCNNICNSFTDYIFLLDNEYLRKLMLKYLSIEISINDTLPKNVCRSCKCTLGDFNKFAENCSAFQLVLSNISGNLPSTTAKEMTGDVKLEPGEDFKESFGSDSMDKCSVKSEVESNTCDGDELHLSEVSFRTQSNSNKTVKKPKPSSKTKSKKQISKTIRVPESRIKNKEMSDNKSLYSIADIDVSIKKSKSSKKKSSTLFNSFIDLACHLCPETFKSWSSLSGHAQNIHSTKPQITCLCNKELKSKGSLYMHIMKHDQSAGFRCENCQKRFFSETNYRLHVCSPPSYYDCLECGKSFSSSDSLKQHAILKHSPLEERISHQCEFCSSKFNSKGGLKQHVTYVHNKDKSHICEICGAVFCTKYQLKKHVFTHSTHRPFQCSSCSKSFKTKPHIIRHILVHNDIKVKCKECPSEFKSKSSLHRHMCVHRDVYKYVCNECNRGFKWKSAFDTHMNNHTGYTPFSCPWCPKSFRDSGNFCLHKRKYHPLEQAEVISKKGIFLASYDE